jgi:hypothetical protein
MSQEKRDWRALCRAIVDERDSEKLFVLAKRLLDVLDEQGAGGNDGMLERKASRWPENLTPRDEGN